KQRNETAVGCKSESHVNSAAEDGECCKRERKSRIECEIWSGAVSHRRRTGCHRGRFPLLTCMQGAACGHENVDRDDCEQAEHDREFEPAPAVQLIGKPEIPLDRVSQYEANEQWRTRPLCALHHPAEYAEAKQSGKVDDRFFRFK